MSKKVWFVTGGSRGFGRVWIEAALERGDLVAATARDLASVAHLRERFGDAVLPLELDVTNAEQVRARVREAHSHFGRLDVIVNNAGYSLIGTIEEAAVADIRDVFETNVFGAVNVVQAATPILRAQGHGHVLGISSGVGLVTSPLIGYYCATKWAFEAVHESLALEIAPFGVKVTIVEPGAYATELGSPRSMRQSVPLAAYESLRREVFGRLGSMRRGDPEATPHAIFAVVDAAEPPLRLNLGADNLEWVRGVYADRVREWEAWRSVSESAQDRDSLAAATASRGASSTGAESRSPL